MSRFVLRARGAGPTADEVVERVRALPNATVVDRASPRMLLVDVAEPELQTLVESLPGWIMVPEQTIPLPDPRPKPRRGEHAP